MQPLERPVTWPHVGLLNFWVTSYNCDGVKHSEGTVLSITPWLVLKCSSTKDLPIKTDMGLCLACLSRVTQGLGLACSGMLPCILGFAFRTGSCPFRIIYRYSEGGFTLYWVALNYAPTVDVDMSNLSGMKTSYSFYMFSVLYLKCYNRQLVDDKTVIAHSKFFCLAALKIKNNKSC